MQNMGLCFKGNQAVLSTQLSTFFLWKQFKAFLVLTNNNHNALPVYYE